MDNKIGVFLPCLKMGVEEGLKKAQEIGARGIQLWNSSGGLAPDNLSQDDRVDFLKKVSSYNLEISALCGHMSFTDEAGIEERIERFKKVLDLSIDLKNPIVTTESGKVKEGESQAWEVLVEAMKELTAYAGKVGSCVALEAGPMCLINSPRLIRQLADRVGSPALKVNYDPANMVMGGYDPIAGVFELKDLIVHTHAKDGIKLPAEEKLPFREMPLGEGGVPFKKYIQALKEIGYKGYLTIERETGNNPVADIRKAKEFLQDMLKRE